MPRDSKGRFIKGNIPWHKGKKDVYSEETRRKMAKGRKGKSPYNKGKKTGQLSKKHRKKISQRLKGIVRSKETKNKISKTRKKKFKTQGYLNTPETREKIRLAGIGKMASNKGVPSSKEQIEKWKKTMKKKMEDPVFKEEYSKTRRRIILNSYATGKFSKTSNTDIEKRMRRGLIDKGFIEGEDFFPQYIIEEKFACDFVFPFQKIIVECDGDYFHANPKIYPVEKLHPKQERNLKRDRAKTAYIKKIDNGTWTLLRFWGSDIKKDVSKCVDKIEKVFYEK